MLGSVIIHTATAFTIIIILNILANFLLLVSQKLGKCELVGQGQILQEGRELVARVQQVCSQQPTYPLQYHIV